MLLPDVYNGLDWSSQSRRSQQPVTCLLPCAKVLRLGDAEAPLPDLWQAVMEAGGYQTVSANKGWAAIGRAFGAPKSVSLSCAAQHAACMAHAWLQVAGPGFRQAHNADACMLPAAAQDDGPVAPREEGL